MHTTVFDAARTSDEDCDCTLVGDQKEEVEEIKKDPALALKKIKEIEDRERKHGVTKFSEQRKEELKQLLIHLVKKKCACA